MTHQEFREKWGFSVRVIQRTHCRLEFRAKCLPKSSSSWHGLVSPGWVSSRKKAIARMDKLLTRYFIPRKKGWRDE